MGRSSDKMSPGILSHSSMPKTPPQRLSRSTPSSGRLNFFKAPIPWLYAFWKFSRPHTVIGTSLSVVSLFAITWATADSLGTTASRIPPLSFVLLSLFAWLACLCGNVYIVGLNQIEDVAIDRINKPHLPLASGEFSHREGVILVISTGFLAIALALSQGPFLFGMVGLSLLLGTAYSLPPLRLKRFPFWASFCILTVRGAIVNLGLFLHYGHKFGLPLTIPAKVWALTIFILIFSIAIAIFKDIPDIEGDRRYNITTFTVRLGQRAVFNIARIILTICYVGMALMGSFIPGVNPPFLVITHLLILSYVWRLSRRVAFHPTDCEPSATANFVKQTDPLRTLFSRHLPRPVETAKPISYPAFYQFIWKLFFWEYLIFPMACWLS